MYVCIYIYICINMAKVAKVVWVYCCPAEPQPYSRTCSSCQDVHPATQITAAKKTYAVAGAKGKPSENLTVKTCLLLLLFFLLLLLLLLLLLSFLVYKPHQLYIYIYIE